MVGFAKKNKNKNKNLFTLKMTGFKLVFGET